MQVPKKRGRPKLVTPTNPAVGAYLTIKPTELPSDTELMKRPDYDGAELKPFDGRPGAMVAYSLPSRGLR